MTRSLTAIVASASLATAAIATPPNILFIMSDDHAAHAIGAYGGRLAKLDPTPHLDRLAARGVRLSNAFCVNSICTPSRATIMTGQHSHANGVTTLIGKIGPGRQTLAHEMKKAGYETAVIGKWHLKEEPGAFDFYTVLPGQGSYFNPIFRVRGEEPWPGNEIRVAGYDCKHSSDAITDLSVKWLRGRAKRKGERKPFFLMHHFKAPHDNFENAERYDWLYEDVDIPEPEANSLWERGKHGPSGAPRYGTSVGKRNSRRNMGDHMFVDDSLDDANYKRVAYQRYLKKFLRCVKGVDDNIGRLLGELEELGELDNTIVIYTADQGFMLGEHDYIDKRWMYEESLRMPFIIAGPGVPEGEVVDDVINNVDFAPTLLELAGVEAAAMPAQFQGRSFAPNLRGDTPGDWPTSTYYRYWMHMAHHDNPAHMGIRTKTHKLIFFYGQPLDESAFNRKPAAPTEPYWELYDLTADPHEMNNLIGQPGSEGVFAALKAELVAKRKEIGDTDEDHPIMAELLAEDPY